jgi:hypothetical protein
MNSHKNARLTRLGRVRMLEQITKVGLKAAAGQAGISVRRARMWRKRWGESGEDGLCDRSSRPQVSPHQRSPDRQERIVNLRRNHRLAYTVIAQRVGVSMATVGCLCAKAGVNKLPPLEATPPPRRYERPTPGEILHLDTKKTGALRSSGPSRHR